SASSTRPRPGRASTTRPAGGSAGCGPSSSSSASRRCSSTSPASSRGSSANAERSTARSRAATSGRRASSSGAAEMSWRLRVRHTTAYEYAGVVHASYNEARISPLDTSHQFTLEHRVEVNPPANIFRYRDYWGTRVHVFDIHHEHMKLGVTGTSVVETAERTPSADTSVTWDAIDAPGLMDRFF